jgi:hypothetical protein
MIIYYCLLGCVTNKTHVKKTMAWGGKTNTIIKIGHKKMYTTLPLTSNLAARLPYGNMELMSLIGR